MATEFMHIPKIRDYSNRFETITQVLRAVNQVLEAQVRILETTGFIGNVGGAAFVRYIRDIQPAIEELATKCQHIAEFIRIEADQIEAAQQ